MENCKIVTHKGGRGRFRLGAVSAIFLQIQWGDWTRARGKRGSPVSRFQPRAWSFACLACVVRRTKKKGRLLVAYGCLWEVSNYSIRFWLKRFWCLGLVSFRLWNWGGRLRREVTHGGSPVVFETIPHWRNFESKQRDTVRDIYICLISLKRCH